MLPRHGRPLESTFGCCNRQADKASHLGSAIYFRPKNGKAEKLGHSQSEYKGSFKVEILGTRPPP